MSSTSDVHHGVANCQLYYCVLTELKAETCEDKKKEKLRECTQKLEELRNGALLVARLWQAIPKCRLWQPLWQAIPKCSAYHGVRNNMCTLLPKVGHNVHLLLSGIALISVGSQSHLELIVVEALNNFSSRLHCPCSRLSANMANPHGKYTLASIIVVLKLQLLYWGTHGHHSQRRSQTHTCYAGKGCKNEKECEEKIAEEESKCEFDRLKENKKCSTRLEFWQVSLLSHDNLM